MKALQQEFAGGMADTVRGDIQGAIAKRASGPGHRDANIPEEFFPRSQKLDDATLGQFKAIATEFRELADRARKLCRTPHTVMQFTGWEHRHRLDLWAAMQRRDIEAARAILSHARETLDVILDNAKLDLALGEKHPEKLLIPGWNKAI